MADCKRAEVHLAHAIAYLEDCVNRGDDPASLAKAASGVAAAECVLEYARLQLEKCESVRKDRSDQTKFSPSQLMALEEKQQVKSQQVQRRFSSESLELSRVERVFAVAQAESEKRESQVERMSVKGVLLRSSMDDLEHELRVVAEMAERQIERARIGPAVRHTSRELTGIPIARFASPPVISACLCANSRKLLVILQGSKISSLYLLQEDLPELLLLLVLTILYLPRQFATLQSV